MANNFTPGGVFNSNANASGSAPSTPAGQYVEDWTYDNGTVTVTFGDGTVTTFTIETGGDTPVTGGNPVVSVTFATPILTIVLESGLSFQVDLSDINTDTNNYVDGGSLTGTNLSLTREGLDDVTIDLSGLLGESDIATNGLTFTETQGTVTLTIADNSVTLSSAVIPPVDPQPPGNPPDFNLLNDNVVDFDGPSIPSGGSVTNTAIGDISATDTSGADVDIIAPTPDADGSFQVNVPAETEVVMVPVTYTGTDSNGDAYTEMVTLEADGFVPFFTFHTPPQTTSNSSIPMDANTDESDAAIKSGSQFSITTTEVRRRWLVAETSGLTFMNQGFPLMGTELSDTITLSGVTFYQYDFGVAAAGTLEATVN